MNETSTTAETTPTEKKVEIQKQPSFESSPIDNVEDFDNSSTEQKTKFIKNSLENTEEQYSDILKETSLHEKETEAQKQINLKEEKKGNIKRFLELFRKPEKETALEASDRMIKEEMDSADKGLGNEIITAKEGIEKVKENLQLIETLGISDEEKQSLKETAQEELETFETARNEKLENLKIKKEDFEYLIKKDKTIDALLGAYKEEDKNIKNQERE